MNRAVTSYDTNRGVSDVLGQLEDIADGVRIS